MALLQRCEKKALVSRAKICVMSETYSTFWWAMGSDDHSSLKIDFFGTTRMNDKDPFNVYCNRTDFNPITQPLQERTGLLKVEKLGLAAK